MSGATDHTGIKPGEVTAFLTDSTLCIGCKACEVACKEWNGISADGFDFTGWSYDNTGALGHSTWRHVKFVEGQITPGVGGNSAQQVSWEFSSDVCKHCEVAGCLEACPTGSLVRTEFGSVYLQPDICNGCAFCTDRQKAGLMPACAKACPTESIKFGRLDELRLEAEGRLATLQARGMSDAQIYDPTDSSVKGLHALFIIRGEPETYNLPPEPEVPTVYLKEGWKSAAIEAVVMISAVVTSFLFLGRKG
jgi:formate dehydrogenase iron-sulfur subunit